MFWCVTIEGQSDGSSDYYTDIFYLTKEEALAEHTPGHWEDEHGFHSVYEPKPHQYIPRDMYGDISYGPGVLHTCEPDNYSRIGSPRRRERW